MTRGRQLFRQEALDHRSQYRQWGDVARLEPLPLKFTVWFIVFIVAAIGAFLFVGEYARKETALGFLTPASGTSKIYAPRPGHIREVHVKDGQAVSEGQVLLTIDSDQFAAGGLDVNTVVLESLSDQRSRIEGNIKSEDERTLSERERLASLIDGLEGEILQLEAQLKVQNERLDVIASELEAGRQLRAKGILTAPELRRRELMQLEQKQAVSAITQQISAKRNQLTEAEFNLAQLPTVMAQRVQSLRNDLAAVEQRLAETKGRQSYVLRAPVGGRVTTVQARVGQTADPQKLQLEIIPVGSELQAELYLPARAIGFVGSGQKVRLLYDAFPYQHFGSHSGRVVSISHTMLTSADSGGPIRLNEPAYRIIAKLDQTHIEAFGKQVPLQPDMLLKADIILERRTLVEWVLNPLRSVRM